LGQIGYGPDLIRENYEFTDFLAEPSPLRVAALAAFFQEPTSYRNACFGVVVPNHESGAPLVSQYRSLGAPMILELTPNGMRRWAMTSQSEPKLLDSTEFPSIERYFNERKDEWAPDAMLRAKGLGPRQDVMQLDFFDFGFLPLLQREVQRKLDTLLRAAIQSAIYTHKAKGELDQPDYPPLFRLIFRLLAGKLHADRGTTGNYRHFRDAEEVLSFIHNFYFKEAEPVAVLTRPDVTNAAWESINGGLHFQNLSVDVLSYVYENTLVTPQTRKTYGTHGTPANIAEFLVRRLPFETLAPPDRTVFEPFAGHAVFLVAAMQRMKDLMGNSMSPSERHRYFTKTLSGLELDAFAREVSWLSLVLADYPNPDGWDLAQGDAFESPSFDLMAKRSNIILCNPPFALFTAEERARYSKSHALTSPHKPVEVLARVLENPPVLLGFVLPRIFVDGRGYRPLREKLNTLYDEVQVVTLPDKVFRHSATEAALLIASGRTNSPSMHLTCSGVYDRDLARFKDTGEVSYQTVKLVARASSLPGDALWLPNLNEIWERLDSLRPLSDVARMIHGGVQFNQPLKDPNTPGKVNTLLVADDLITPFHVKGLYRVPSDVEPFIAPPHVYLNLNPDIMRSPGIGGLPWGEPKIMVNAHRKSRGPWAIVALLDHEGLALYENYIGIWAHPGTPLEFLAAVLNSPLANAYVASHEGKRDVGVQTLKNLPFPKATAREVQAVVALVDKYVRLRRGWIAGQELQGEAALACFRLLCELDAAVLDLYRLPSRLERRVLDEFSNWSRPGPVNFVGYFPPEFKPYIPWSLYISKDYEESRASKTLSRLRPINDEEIAEALRDVGL